MAKLVWSEVNRDEFFESDFWEFTPLKVYNSSTGRIEDASVTIVHSETNTIIFGQSRAWLKYDKGEGIYMYFVERVEWE